MFAPWDTQIVTPHGTAAEPRGREKREIHIWSCGCELKRLWSTYVALSFVAYVWKANAKWVTVDDDGSVPFFPPKSTKVSSRLVFDMTIMILNQPKQWASGWGSLTLFFCHTGVFPGEFTMRTAPLLDAADFSSFQANQEELQWVLSGNSG